MSRRKIKKFSRREVLKTTAAVAGATLAASYISDAEAAIPTVRMLMWEDYIIQETVTAFEDKYKARIAPQFFDGNSEAFNKMKAGGTEDFDLVMADGFWPRLYLRDGLIQNIDESLVPNLANSFTDFKPGAYDLLHDKPARGSRRTSPWRAFWPPLRWAPRATPGPMACPSIPTS